MGIESAVPKLRRAAHILLYEPTITSRTAVHMLLRESVSTPSWIKSLLPGQSALRDEVPWMPFRARLWLESHLSPDMNAFEYGSGGSTLFLSKRVNWLVSIEHDEEWHSLVSAALVERGIQNCEYILQPPQQINGGITPTYNPQSYTSTKFEGLSFERYVKSIDEYPDASFDLVIVDGRARLSCLTIAPGKVRPGGHLMLDDTNRKRYSAANDLLATYRRTDFIGGGPYNKELKQASVWKIE